MFELRSVSKRFGATRALEGVDLAFERGATTALIGPSGCGKSTLLRLLLGLERPTAGTVAFDGAAVSDGNWTELRQRIGYAPQEGGLFPHLTAAANATLVARHLARPAAEIEARLAGLAEGMHLERATLERFPGELSGGQRQRVALMRALMLDPDVLLLDEPLGALDPMIRFELQEDLARLFADLGKTVVIVTHDLSEAAFLGRTVVLLNDGSVRQVGPIEDFLGAPADAFVERFVRAQRPSLEPGASR